MFGAVAVGETPRIVGVISTVAAFDSLDEFPCDIVEVRLDKLGAPEGWLERCLQIEAAGKPVLLPLRSRSEGGDWPADKPRLRIFGEAMPLSAIDVELRSDADLDAARIARHFGKPCVLSYHNFQQTPPLEELEAIVAQAEHLGGVTKIAAKVQSDADAAILKALLQVPRRQPLCVIGMGEDRAELRIELARLGSCLAYGYLDTSAAPGQISAAELSKALTLPF